LVKKQVKKIKLLKAVFAVIWLVFVGRLVMLQIVDRDRFLQAALNQQNLIIDIEAKRGTIYDRNLKIMARDIDSYSYYIVPEKIKNRKLTARKLARITGKNGWLTEFTNRPRFLWVARKTDERLSARLENSNIETLNHLVEPRRVYPGGDLARSLLGRVDIDVNGLEGMEVQYDDYLAGEDGKVLLRRDGLGKSYQFEDKPLVVSSAGSDLVLTIDLDLQQILEQEMTAAMIENNSVSGIGLFLKVGTGEMLACATMDSLGRPADRNRAICDQYEPGSTFKIMTAAVALASGIFEPDTILFVENGKFRLGKHIIRDDHEYDSLSVEDIIVFSSNIGALKMALCVGEKAMYKAIKEAGFITKSGIDFPGEADGVLLPPGWKEHYLANISFGHGISASPLQIASLYGAFAEAGNLYKPYIAKALIDTEGDHHRLNKTCLIRNIFKPKVIETVNSFLRGVVERGTAVKANSEIVAIAGKTGTALKIKENGRGYDHKKARASFVGYFPADNPQVVGIIIFDTPKTSRYGGETSAPLFRRVAERYYCLPQFMLEQIKTSNELVFDRTEPSFDESNDEMDLMMKINSRFFSQTDQKLVPDFRGLTLNQALTLAAVKGVEFELSGSGVVKSQSPRPASAYHEGTIIKLRCESR